MSKQLPSISQQQNLTNMDFKFDSNGFSYVEIEQKRGSEISMSFSLTKGFHADFKEGDRLIAKATKGER